MSWFKQKTDSNEESKIMEDKEADINIKPENTVKMIWIEGFKGTNSDMKCNNFQYELGKEIKYDGKPSLCSSGFHFCTELNDVFSYYQLNNKNRFFKIKALVPEDYQMVKYEASARYSISHYDSKYVTGSIILEKELHFEDLKQYIFHYYPMIEDEDEFKSVDFNHYDIYAINKFIHKMESMGYSEAFATVLSNNTKILNSILDYANAFKQENLSPDLKVYMLINLINKLS